MSNIKYVLGRDSITVYLDSKPYTINKQAHTYPMVLEAVKKGDETALRNAIDIRNGIVTALQANGKGKVTIDGSRVMYMDREVTGLIASRIFEVIRLGFDVKPMVKFIENLMENPSKRAVDELFGFLDVCKLPITDDGHFLAYKRVRANYTDVHSGKFDNSVGKVLSMPRNMVDEDKNNTCSYGLHFCSYEYLDKFGGERIMVVKINPADVVAIPADYNNSKGRTCRYEVIDELPVSEYNGRQMPTKPIKEDYVPAGGGAWDDAEYPEDAEWDESEEEWEESWEESDEEFTVEDELADLDSDDADDILDLVREGEITLDDIASDYGLMLDTVQELMRRNNVRYASHKAKPAAAAPVDSNPTGKLSPDQVRQIRRLLNKGDSLASIARAYGVHPRTIGRIRDGEAWNDV